MTSSNKAYWLTSGFYSILLRVSILLFNFATTFLLFRIFSLKEVGVWGLFLMIVSVIEVARSGLIQNGLIRFLSISPSDEHSKIISASFSLNIILSVFTILLIVSGSQFLCVNVLKAPSLETLLYYYILTTLLLLPYFQFLYIQQANLDFKGVFWVVMSRQGTFFLGVVTIYILGYKPTMLNLVHLQTFAAFVGMIAGYFFARKFFTFTLEINRAWIKKLFNFGKFGFVTNLSTIISGGMDQAMLSNMISTSAVALQRAALQITNVVEVPTNAMADIVFPQSARRMNQDGQGGVNYLYQKSVSVTLSIIVPFLIVVFLFPDFIITIITGGGEYLQSKAILQVTVLYAVLIPFDRLGGTIFDSTGRQKLNFYLQILNVCTNFLSNLFFITKFGIIGAAYGTLVTFFISFAIRQTILRRVYNIHLWSVVKSTFLFYGECYHVLKQSLLKGKIPKNPLEGW
jgi:O-antigen/teichoic acid export membrane protein